MAFDGITIANIAQELNQTIVGGKINKIAQPENDELMITIKNNRTVYRLLLSASASLPLNLPTTIMSTALNINCKMPDSINGSANETSLSIMEPLHISISYLLLFKEIAPLYFLSSCNLRPGRNFND